MRVPLDRARPGGRLLRIYFERHPRTDRTTPAASTVVAIEGGPGYSTTASRDGYLRLWRPVSSRRDLLLVDLRGTGRSGALACPAFAKSAVGYAGRARRCALQLGPDRDLYSTAEAVEDLEDVLQALGSGRIDLYGDSYGSYAAQAFALRHPERLRSLVLDSTYQLPGSDPAGADLVAAVRRGLRLSCARRPGCPARAEGVDPVQLVARFAARLRKRALVGRAPDGDGNLVRVRLDEDAFVQVVSLGYSYFGVWRDLPAAIVAAEHGDTAPILRLAAETVTVDAGAADPPSYSEALYAAVTCHDYPQLWNPVTAVEARPAEVRRRLAAYPPGTFAPFTAASWTGVDYEGFLACLDWPSSSTIDPPVPPAAVYPDVPTLVLNGDLDTITAAAGAREVSRRFPHSFFVEVRNSIHVTAIYDRDGCASLLYARFVRTLTPGDTSCAERVAEVRVLPSFPRSLAATPAAGRAAGDASQVLDRRLASAAAMTVADVIARWQVNYDGTGVGLRGGRWAYEGDTLTVFTLRDVELIPGVAVSGDVRWSVYGGGVSASLQVTSTAGLRATLLLSWSLRVPLARAAVRGSVDGRVLRAAMLAP